MKRTLCQCGCSGSQTKRQKLRTFTGWLVPSVILTLMPKCPLCVAAYVSLFTGISIGVTAASWIRWVGIGVCVVVLCLAAKRSAVLIRRKHVSDVAVS